MKTKQSFSGSGCFPSDAGNLPRGEAVSLGFEELLTGIHSSMPLRPNRRTGTDWGFLVPSLVEFVTDSPCFFPWVVFLMISLHLFAVWELEGGGPGQGREC